MTNPPLSGIHAIVPLIAGGYDRAPADAALDIAKITDPLQRERLHSLIFGALLEFVAGSVKRPGGKQIVNALAEIAGALATIEGALDVLHAARVTATPLDGIRKETRELPLTRALAEIAHAAGATPRYIDPDGFGFPGQGRFAAAAKQLATYIELHNPAHFAQANRRKDGVFTKFIIRLAEFYSDATGKRPTAAENSAHGTVSEFARFAISIWLATGQHAPLTAKRINGALKFIPD